MGRLGSGEPPWFVARGRRRPEPDAEGRARSGWRTAAARPPRRWSSFHGVLRETYGLAGTHRRRGGGRERYLLFARQFLGATLDPEDAYGRAWDELARIESEMAAGRRSVLPGRRSRRRRPTSTATAMPSKARMPARVASGPRGPHRRRPRRHALRRPAGPQGGGRRRPPGGAAAQYYTAPTADFSRPGRTWYPTMGATRFPTWAEVSTCYHEGVPGHHLQLAQCRVEAERLSLYQTRADQRQHRGLGPLRRTADGRVGFFELPATGSATSRPSGSGPCASSSTSACTSSCPSPPVSRSIPASGGRPSSASSSSRPNRRRTGVPAQRVVRYLGRPSQAIGYKLGERVWLAGRGARPQGDAFDLKGWHTAALNPGPSASTTSAPPSPPSDPIVLMQWRVG